MAEQGRPDRAAWEGEMFRLLAENVKDYAIFVVDPHRHILSWSKGAERLLGFSEEEIVGQQCDCFFTPEDVRRGVPQKSAHRRFDGAVKTLTTLRTLTPTGVAPAQSPRLYDPQRQRA